MAYKYKKPENRDVIFLEVVKKPFWVDRIDEELESRYEPMFNVGDITWVNKSYLDRNDSNKLHEDAICPENNKFYINFDPSCFKILHTTIQKIK